MDKIKIVFMGTPEFASPSLEALIKADFDVKLVVSQEDRKRGRGKKLQYTPVKETALKYDIEVFQPKNINSQESIEKLKSIDTDYFVVAAYGQILTKDIIEIPKKDILNVHSSLLPKYRGAAPINWAIINGESETGVTIMEIEEGLDTGDMIISESIKIKPEDNASTIHDKLKDLGGKLIVRAIKGLENGTLTKKEQDDNKSSYAPMLSRDDGKIDWSKSSQEIFNHIRGMTPWPSAFTKYMDENIKIHKISLESNEILGEIGEIINIDEEYIYIQTGDGIVKVEELQFPNKRKMATGDYLRGHEIKIGEIFK